MIDRIFGYLKKGGFLHDVGDDATVFDLGSVKAVVSVDSFVYGTHFNRLVPLDAVGFRSVAGAASDIAAMGVKPGYILVSLGLTGRFPEETALGIYSGIKKACKKWGLKVAGGDIVKSRRLFVSVCALGFGEKVIRRSGATPGDIVFITGYPGLSSAGLKSLTAGKKGNELTRSFLYPQIHPEMAAGIASFANSLIDSSDGLIASCRMIAASSNAGINIESGKVPLKGSLLKFCRRRKTALKFALTGGEDYYLLGTAPPEKFAKIKQKVFKIGSVTKGRGVFVDGYRAVFKEFRHFNK
ncbi:MAG: thiamine-phosphate kinase [bacterium]